MKLKATSKAPSNDTLSDVSLDIENNMIHMLVHLHFQVTTSIQDNTANLPGMKSLLIKLQGNESMPSIRSIWDGFAKTWNGALPDGATKMRADLFQLKKLETTVRENVPAEKTPTTGRPYTQETAWAAYNEAYKSYRILHIHQKLMAFVKNDLTPYVQSFKILTAEDSGLSPDTAQQMVLQRSLVDFVGDFRTKTAAEENMAVLGCSRSYFDDHPDQSSQEVAFMMNTPMLAGGDIKNVTVLTLAAPPLDDTKHPVWNNFVDKEGRLKQDAYRKHCNSLCSLIKQASDENPDKRVVMSAIGMGAFLSALSEDEAGVARDIAANQLAQLAKALIDKGRSVAYSDVSRFHPNAVIIQGSLKTHGMDALPFVGKLPDSWMNENDLYINAGDPYSCAGNGGGLDDSMEGRLGRNSLMSAIHVQVAINAQLAKTTQQ